MSFSLQSEREEYFPKILPRLCLNRYYMAEGVKLYNQETWKRVFGSEGKSYVEKYLKDVVKYYVECTRADNHAVREAACHCIAELAIKLDKAVLGPFVDQLIQILLECFKDDSWPVRDTACVAAGNFVAQFPTESQDKIPELFPLFLTNLKDPISSVRQGAALAMSSTVRACGDDAMLVKVLDVVKDGLKGLKEQPVESHRYSELESGAANFGVAKKIRDNDAALHENQPMFSCGSLAPKMGRSGCTDGKFQKPSEPWEFADGCVHLFAELTAQNDIHGKLHPLLFLVADACRQRHYTLHLTFIETVLKRLPGIAGKARALLLLILSNVLFLL